MRWKKGLFSSLIGGLGGFLCLDVIAGEVLLRNGDAFRGHLIKITEEHIVWYSDSLGEIELKKAWVIDLSTMGDFKLRGSSVPCKWDRVRSQTVTFACVDGKVRRVSLLTLQHVVPFDGHKNANFGYGGDVRLSGWRQEGNASTEYWEAKASVRLRHADLRHNLSVRYDSQSTETQVTGQSVTTSQNRGKGIYALDWFFLPKWYWSNQLSIETDSRRNLDEEYALASGAGYQFWESKNSALSNEFGLQVSKRRFDDTAENPPDPATQRDTALRFSTDYRYKLPLSITLYHKHEVLRALGSGVSGEAIRWEFDSETGVNLPIGFGVSASFGLDWDYVNQARNENPDASRSDAIYRIGVNYDW